VWGGPPTPITRPRWCAVHPHACGADPHRAQDQRRGGRFIPTRVGRTANGSWPTSRPIGSSPRVWGGRAAQHHPSPVERFIPTRVGRTRTPHGPACPHRGSSPRVWGGPLAPCRARHQHRFIPTRVGRTGTVPLTGHATAVHPHACGADAIAAATTTAITGSSPRVWGGRRDPSSGFRWPQVHPHACGADTSQRLGF